MVFYKYGVKQEQDLGQDSLDMTLQRLALNNLCDCRSNIPMSALWYIEKASKYTSAAGFVTILNALAAVPKIFMCHLLLFLGPHPWFSAPTPHSLITDAPFPRLYFQEWVQWKRVTHFLFCYRIVWIVWGHRKEWPTTGCLSLKGRKIRLLGHVTSAINSS